MEEEIPIKAPKFSLEGLSFNARIISVYDGDTIKAIFKYRGVYNTWSCRIIGIDTPELRTKNPEEKELGYKARDFLRGLILNKVVKIKCHDFDKYGRLLVDVKVKLETIGSAAPKGRCPPRSGVVIDNKGAEDAERSVNDILIQNKYALPYDGGKKKEFNIENYR